MRGPRGPTAFAVHLDALSLLIEIADAHGQEAALTIWEQAEADAIAAGAPGVDLSRIEQTFTKYLEHEDTL